MAHSAASRIVHGLSASICVAIVAHFMHSGIIRAQTSPPATQQIAVHLVRLQNDSSPVSFGLPIAPGVLTDGTRVQVLSNGKEMSGVNTKVLLRHYDFAGQPTSVRALLIQFPSSAMSGAAVDVQVVLNGLGSLAGSTVQPFANLKFSSPEVVTVTDRRITFAGGLYSFTETNVTPRTLYPATEPKVLATYPDGYLAGAGILGEQMSRTRLLAKPTLAGLKTLSDEFDLFANSMAYADGYNMNPSGVYDSTNFEGWLYDRCDTYLTAYAHLNKSAYLRYGLRACAFYAGTIQPDGTTNIKPTPDIKYSHVRGLFAYYALTGDEVAQTAIANIVNMWRNDPLVVAPYEAGHIRSSESLWTERLLAASIEGLTYGFFFTGDPKFKTGAQALFDTAYRHITTTNQSELNAITLTPPYGLPPQNCFAHSALQQAEGNANEPWCSIWMSELTVDSFLRYAEMTGDTTRTDQIFIRLGRFFGDVGSMYEGTNPGVSFGIIAGSGLADAKTCCYNPAQDASLQTRRLMPAYGSGVDYQGVTQKYPDFSDYLHCPDASALVAAAIRASVRQNSWNTPWVHGPFHTEGEAFTAMFHELANCSRLMFPEYHRPKRNPANWVSTELSGGYFGGDPTQQTAWINSNSIGYPSYPSDPQRKLSWWFNTSMLSFRILDQTGIDFSSIRAGFVQPTTCSVPATPLPPSTPHPSFSLAPPKNLHQSSGS